MKPINEILIIAVCKHIAINNLSYRKTADIFNIDPMTVCNYTREIENINSELYEKVKICLEERRKKSRPNNLKDIYEEICNYFICGNALRQTSVKFNSNICSIHYLFHNHVKVNDPELYVMILEMIELDKLKSVRIRKGRIRKMNIEEILNLCQNIIDDKLKLKTASKKFGLDTKTIKVYISHIKNIDSELYDEVCKHLWK